MSQTRKRRMPVGLGGRLLGAMAVTAAWSMGFAGAVTPAVAADVQSKQWYLGPMHAEEMWKVSTGEGIKVAVIDSGVNPSTPSLKGQVLKGFDATGADGDEYDDYDGHGTSMAELIAGTGKGGGLQGLAPGAKIIPFRVTDTEFQNKHSVNANDTEDAIRAAADSDARIISMSMASDFPGRGNEKQSSTRKARESYSSQELETTPRKATRNSFPLRIPRWWVSPQLTVLARPPRTLSTGVA